MASLHGIPDAKELINSDETFSYYWGTVAVVKCIRTVVFAAMVNFPGGYGIRPYAVEAMLVIDREFPLGVETFPLQTVALPATINADYL